MSWNRPPSPPPSVLPSQYDSTETLSASRSFNKMSSPTQPDTSWVSRFQIQATQIPKVTYVYDSSWRNMLTIVCTGVHQPNMRRRCRLRIRHSYMPTGCDQDKTTSTRGFQQKEWGQLLSRESDVQGYHRHRQDDMARRGHKRDVQRPRTYAFGISPDLGSILDSVREHQGILLRSIRKLVVSSVLLLIDRWSMLNRFDKSNLGH
jgi:hypothetical protein